MRRSSETWLAYQNVIFTFLLGIHAIFGGFLMGVIIPREGPFATWLAERIEDIVVLLLLPLYFTYSGLRTALGSLDSWVFILFYFILFYFILKK